MKATADKLTAWLSLRTLVVAVAVLLVLAPSLPPAVHWLDQLAFRTGVQLHKVPEPTLGISLVELPAEEVHFLTRDPGRAAKTRSLLDRVTASSKVVVGLILPEPLGHLPEGLQEFAGELWDGEGPAPALAGAEDFSNYLRVSRGVERYRSHPRVVLDAGSAPVTGLPVEVSPSTAGDYLNWLPPLVRPQIPDAANSMPANRLHLFTRAGEAIHPSFVLGLYGHFSGAAAIGWQQFEGVQLGASFFPLSPDSSFRPYPYQSPLGRVSLDQALEERLGNNLILLGPEGSGRLDTMANALRSFDAQSYYRTPAWFVGAEVALTLLIAFYLAVLLPRLSYIAGILASSLLVVVLLVFQLGAQITQWQWLPLGITIQLLVIGHLAMLLWKRQRDRSLQLQAAAHGARYQLGLQLFRDGRADDALLAIKECYTSEAVLSLMYDIAAQQERKRLYNEAIKTYMAVVTRQKNYKDAAEKVEKLMAFSSSGAMTLGNDSDIAKTLIISESSISKPVLGRYEIERELGRGAMGVVYLGRDPKIARQVAIKTLSYGQLDPRELEEFKQRFFREAEAAGRLNHPNIVTIYDVGEEHDLAFIAMDYVKGNALSAYVHEDKLLPVPEVLDICAEVADALEYAHKNQIIHRDIKPANIMYEAEAERIKVTDFGVARIVDSSKTSTGDILGSPLYMAPEQLKGDKVGRETDVYSLGVTLYQLLTGKLPFSGENLASLTYNIINERHPGIRELRPDLPKGITRIINKALHKDTDKRYPTAGAFAEALRKLAMEL
ncbi:serine/threonine-protein kinase [Gilvimarinus sp. F26214L]|uniref:serine/threonine-protein kinase n=1 Tax=Gilvimarinus sp. DZF01 TaxID=3461371 RepID=UPI0040452A61